MKWIRGSFIKALLHRTFLVAAVAFIILLYCEVLHYFVVLLQCTWPIMNTTLAAENHIKVMFIADTHLLGWRSGHWFDKLRREWQMRQAFQASMFIHKPEVVFFLGDLFDEGKWCSEEEFNHHVARFRSMFAVPEGTRVHALSGNHDEGFHYMMTKEKHDRFEKTFQSPSVRLVEEKGSFFVLVNSMAMEGDHCQICAEAERQIVEVTEQLEERCIQEQSCSQPILLQHFPMYRESDSICDTEDSAPSEEKNVPFRPRYDCLDERSTEMLFSKLQPRLVVSGHTHHGCHVVHANGVSEWSVSSYSWRNRDNPTFLMARISRSNHVTYQCFLPKESSVIKLYILGGIICLIMFIYPYPHVRSRQKIC